MKYMLLRLIIGTAVKIGVAYALKIVTRSVDGITTTLQQDKLSEDARSRLSDQLSALMAVEDFLRKLVGIFGAPDAVPLMATSELTDAADKLRKITDAL